MEKKLNFTFYDFKALKLDAACLGNHDLDLGLVEFSILKDQCTFPWVCSNVKHKENNMPLGGCHEFVVLESKNDKGPKAKFLVLGMVEEEWIDTLSTMEPQDIAYECFVDYIKRRVPQVWFSYKEGWFLFDLFAVQSRKLIHSVSSHQN
jgi:5'-nucleotidase